MADPDAWALAQGDALDAPAHLGSGCVELLYVDPPFFTGRSHRARSGDGGFDDAQWGGDIRVYTRWLLERLAAARPLLTRDGSVMLHLDWRAVHYAKVACDELFGPARFHNEIIWSYNSGGGSRTRYGRKHDTILWYAAGSTPVFNADAARVPYDAVIARKRESLFHPLGKVSGDVLRIPRPPNHAAEWTGWPTQKPLALMEWLVAVHSRPGSLVADLFCGSGTTLVAAVRAGRRAFGMDVSADALAITRRRLEEA